MAEHTPEAPVEQKAPMPGMPEIGLFKAQSEQDVEKPAGSPNLIQHSSSDQASHVPQAELPKPAEPAKAAPKLAPKAPTVFKPTYTVNSTGAAPARTFNRMKKQEAAPVMFKPVSFGNE